ncbi:MAG: VWA domain-containing protein [Gammaproteobacteria bacterium]|nr:VWA domain-containing protein [Gammaproteobacteria bacterium]
MVVLAVALAACNQLIESPQETRSDEKATGQLDAQLSRQMPSPVAESSADAFPGIRKTLSAPGIAATMHSAASVDRERYAELVQNGVQAVANNPVSTFSIDVDTGSYANVRRMLQEGRMPPQNAVRVEELINYFRYTDPAPHTSDVPFRVSTAMAPTPWNGDTQLLRIGLKAWEMPQAELPASNLVFLIDVSGSMNSADKLPLLKRSIKLLTRRLNRDDRVSLVVYAGAAGVVLEPTPGDRQATIEAALDELSAGGSTHGSAGIALAYAKARESFISGGINRVILATDGDFNVGTVDQEALLDLVERERKAGVALTTLGFGRGNFNESLMEQLADHGNGNYAYIDTLLEAHKVLVEQAGGTLLTVAGDVKVQVEFNPARVAEYRLVGYENRALRREDFSNDAVDAGELGAGHSVVALYEIALVDSGGRRLEPLRYAKNRGPVRDARTDELAFVRLRYKKPGESSSRELKQAVTDAVRVDDLARASDDMRFAAAVAAFGQRLAGSAYLGDYGYDDMLALARRARGTDDQGYRSDFLRLVQLAQSLDQRPVGTARGGEDREDGNG